MSGPDSGSPPRQLTHVNLARGWRGGERQTELLVTELARRGWQQQFVGRRGSTLAERLTGMRGLTVTTAGGALTAVPRVRGSLVHAHEARAAQVAWVASRFGSTRYVVTRRVMNRPSGSRITARVYRDAGGICAVSGSVADVLRERFPRLAPVVIPDGWAAPQPDLAAAAEIRQRCGASVLIGCVSALEASKGVAVLIEAARRLLPQQESTAVLVIGDGRDADALRSDAAGMERLTFTGFVPNVEDYLAAMDICVLPSLREGLGSVILEAMAQGVPVIASDTGGIPELVVDDVTGLLVPPGDPHALAARLAELAGDPVRRSRLADEARRRISGLHVGAMAEHYERVYARMAAPARRTVQISSDRSA